MNTNPHVFPNGKCFVAVSNCLPHTSIVLGLLKDTALPGRGLIRVLNMIFTLMVMHCFTGLVNYTEAVAYDHLLYSRPHNWRVWFLCKTS